MLSAHVNFILLLSSRELQKQLAQIHPRQSFTNLATVKAEIYMEFGL
jgi:hypothetical protein